MPSDAERLARAMGWTVDYERLGRQHFASLECHSFALPTSDITRLLCYHDLAKIGCNLVDMLTEYSDKWEDSAIMPLVDEFVEARNKALEALNNAK